MSNRTKARTPLDKIMFHAMAMLGLIDEVDDDGLLEAASVLQQALTELNKRHAVEVEDGQRVLLDDLAGPLMPGPAAELLGRIPAFVERATPGNKDATFFVACELAMRMTRRELGNTTEGIALRLHDLALKLGIGSEFASRIVDDKLRRVTEETDSNINCTKQDQELLDRLGKMTGMPKFEPK